MKKLFKIDYINEGKKDFKRITHRRLYFPILYLLNEKSMVKEELWHALKDKCDFSKEDLSKHKTKKGNEYVEIKYLEFEYVSLWTIHNLKKIDFILEKDDKKLSITIKGKEYLKDNNISEILPDNYLKLQNELYKKVRNKIEEESIEVEEDNIVESQNLDPNQVKDFEYYFNKGQIKFITFHPSYSYEEFVEGLTFNDKKSEFNKEDYHIKTGIFKEICKLAIKSSFKENEDCLDLIAKDRFF